MSYRTVRENGLPYSLGLALSKKGEAIVARLFDILPHGSGINGHWRIRQMPTRRNCFICINEFEAMNEAGMYCHSFPFKVILSTYRNTFEIEEFSCKGTRSLHCCGDGIPEYLTDTIRSAIEVAAQK